MIKEIPFIARMIIIKDDVCEKENQNGEASFYNPNYDSDCEYCLNTTAWD